MAANTSTTPARLSSAAVIPLSTLDPSEPADDLAWLDAAIGDARVVAIGESAHYNHEFLQLRHRMTRYLVQRHGFSAYAMESGFTEAWLVDSWVRGGENSPGGQLGEAMANGMTSLMGLWAPVRTHLEWMCQHNRTATQPVGFYGIDLPGSSASLLPSLDAVLAYFAHADPGFLVEPDLRQMAAAGAAQSAFSVPAALAAYGKLVPETRDALTAGLADLTVRMTGHRLDYLRRTTAVAYERALHSLRLTVILDAIARRMVRGEQREVALTRDAAIAGTVEWILRREERIVLAAHNGHVQRCPLTVAGVLPIPTTMGMHLADRLGEGYRVIGTTSGTGQTLSTGNEFYAGSLFQELQAPEPDSLDGLMAASHDGPFAADLRSLSPSDAEIVQAVSRQRIGAFYGELKPLDAFDVIVHLPHVSAAEPDQAALAASPPEVQEAFSCWPPQ